MAIANTEVRARRVDEYDLAPLPHRDNYAEGHVEIVSEMVS